MKVTNPVENNNVNDIESLIQTAKYIIKTYEDYFYKEISEDLKIIIKARAFADYFLELDEVDSEYEDFYEECKKYSEECKKIGIGNEIESDLEN